MSEHQGRRRRRRGLLWLVGVPAAILLLGGVAWAAYLVASPAADPKADKKAPQDNGFSVVSPPKTSAPAPTATSTPSPSGNNGNNGNGNSGSGAGAGNGGVGNGVGNGNGTDNGGKALVATVQSVTKVAPGVTGTLTLLVQNPNSQDVLVTGLSSQVTSVTTGNRPGLLKCDRNWFVIGGLTGTPRIAGRSSITVQVPVTFVDLAKVNQDNCKGVTYNFSFTVNGRQA